jgi:hypothetical protein
LLGKHSTTWATSSAITPLLIPQPLATTNQLSIHLVLPFPEYGINGFIQFVTFWVWLLSISTVLLNCNHFAVVISTWFFVVIHCMNVLQMVYPCTSWKFALCSGRNICPHCNT